jgi:hypothetical protein
LPYEQEQASALMPQVIALAADVQAHLERSDLAWQGPVDLGPDGVWDDAEHLARIVLADVAHCVERGRMFGERIPAEHWATLGGQLQCLARCSYRSD